MQWDNKSVVENSNSDSVTYINWHLHGKMIIASNLKIRSDSIPFYSWRTPGVFHLIDFFAKGYDSSIFGTVFYKSWSVSKGSRWQSWA